MGDGVAPATMRNGPWPSRVWNHYACQTCGRTTVAKHEDPGVTPFIIPCLAMPGCPGRAQSQFYRGSQADTQVPHLVWYRPKTIEELGAALAAEAHPARRAWMFTHVLEGGCLMRKVP